MFIYNPKYHSKKENHYYSCKWIESGLVFFPYKLTMCCYCGHEGGGHVMLRNNYDGKNIDFGRIFHIKNKFREFHKKGKINQNCIGCPFLTEKEWEQNKNQFDNLYISHWTHCNSKCIYCYSTIHPEEFKYHKPYSVLPFIREMLEKKLLVPGGSIHFGGGEPTLLAEFEELIELLLDYKFYDLRIHTSGIKYSPVIERGIKEGRLYVVVSTDAGCSETYERIKQVPFYKQVRENINKYSKAQKKANLVVAQGKKMKGTYMVSSKFILMPGINDNKKEIDMWLDENKKAHLETTVIDIEENWYRANRDNIPDYIFDLIYYIRERSRKLKTNFELYERIENMLKENARL